MNKKQTNFWARHYAGSKGHLKEGSQKQIDSFVQKSIKKEAISDNHYQIVKSICEKEENREYAERRQETKSHSENSRNRPFHDRDLPSEWSDYAFTSDDF